jgi:hypothetical protein
MPATAINNINYNDTENKRLVEETLNEVETQQSPPQQQISQPPPPQYQQGPPPQMPQYQQGPPPQMPQYQPPQQQYYQQPQEMHQQYYQQPRQQEHFEQPKSSGFSFTFPDTLKKTLMLLVILFLINNNSFKTVLEKIPFTINADGERTFLMTVVVCLLISLIFFITSSVF